MSLQELMNRVLWILQIRELPSSSGASFTTRRGETLRDPVVTQRTLLRRVLRGMNKSAAVRARLNAVAASKAVFLIHQDHPVRCDERRADGTHLRARRIGAVIAHLR